MRVLLLHLDPAACSALRESLADDGHDVTVASGEPTAASPAAKPPEVVVVCLDAHPQRTLDLAAKIGAEAGVDASSILFAGGTQAALGEAERRFPTASFARLDELSTAIASMAD